MLEFERNNTVDVAVLGEFLSRCGWQEPEAATMLGWALAASEEWVLCRLDGDLVGFGRSCRVGPMRRVIFDVVVDSRFRAVGLRQEIVRLLSENAGMLEEVVVFTEAGTWPFGVTPGEENDVGPRHVPRAKTGTYARGPGASGAGRSSAAGPPGAAG